MRPHVGQPRGKLIPISVTIQPEPKHQADVIPLGHILGQLIRDDSVDVRKPHALQRRPQPGTGIQADASRLAEAHLNGSLHRLVEHRVAGRIGHVGHQQDVSRNNVADVPARERGHASGDRADRDDHHGTPRRIRESIVSCLTR